MKMDARPAAAGTSGLDRFFHPRSIAIIGASRDFNKPSGRPLDALIRRGYAGALYPVNPRYRELGGLPCYPSLRDIPGPVDMVIVGVPEEQVMDVLVQCAAKQVEAVVIFSSGFGEVGPRGKAREQEMTAYAREHGMRLLGPNCFGLINTHNAVMASFANIVDLLPHSPRSLGFVTQSGAFGAMIYNQAHDMGVGFSSFVSVGNEADTEFADFIDYLLDDEETRVIGGYLEGEKDGGKLRAVAERALRLRKPVMIMKVGRTGAGARAASSHTGSLAGDDQIYDAFFRQVGIIRLEALQELTSFVTVYRCGRRPNGRGVAILSGSGGGGVMLADKCERIGLSVPELTGRTRVLLDGYLPFYGSGRNPVDLTARVATDPGLLGRCLRAVLADPAIDMALVMIAFSDHTAPVITKDLLDIRRTCDKPVVLASSIFAGSVKAPRLVAHLKAEGIPILADGLQAAQALANLAWYEEKVRQQAGVEVREGKATPAPAAAALLDGPDALTEYDGKRLLAAYGIPVTKEEKAATPEEAVAAARRIGYPVALKILSPDIPHKTEAGGIALDLRSDEDVRRAWEEIGRRVGEAAPAARVEGMLVQEMLGEGLEVIVGTTKDPVFGHAVMFGLGGIFVEALRDVSFRIAPLARCDAEEMVREIKGHRVLRGMRGRTPADTAAIVDIILKVSRLLTDWGGRIRELDINPLIVFPHGAKVVDALVVKEQG